MPRIISSPTQAQAEAGANQPAWLVKIEWATMTSYLCSHSTQTWNGQTWAGAGIELDAWDQRGAPGRLILADPDYAWRTLVLGSGIRDRQISIWQCFVDALATDDPVEVFVGYGDAADIAGWRVAIAIGGNISGRTFSPRERIGPAIGVNFMASPNDVIRWNGQEIRFEAQV